MFLIGNRLKFGFASKTWLGARNQNVNVVQMMQGLSDIFAELDSSMQLKVLVVMRMVFSWYWCITKLVFDPCHFNDYTKLQTKFILENKDDFKSEILLCIGPVLIRSYLMSQGRCWVKLRIYSS